MIIIKRLAMHAFIRGLGRQTVDEIAADGLTVSLFREDYPEKLIEALKSHGILVEEKFPGIYYLSGNTIFDMQIVVTGQLTRETLSMVQCRIERRPHKRKHGLDYMEKCPRRTHFKIRYINCQELS
jgi:hypothetical protein